MQFIYVDSLGMSNIKFELHATPNLKRANIMGCELGMDTGHYDHQGNLPEPPPDPSPSPSLSPSAMVS
uniref:Uncharacterized protein n=1 Tax=Oryza nivara TaxID=4536 RepID=A0A0E0G3P3_ORYNI